MDEAGYAAALQPFLQAPPQAPASMADAFKPFMAAPDPTVAPAASPWDIVSPWMMAALRQRQAVQPPGGRQESLAARVPERMATDAARLLQSIATGAATLPQRALASAAEYERGGDYNPAPILEAAGMMVGSPLAPRGALGSAMGQIAAPAVRRSERFNWPVATTYGKTVDMPIVVNPGRGDIQRALSSAPHGDVRALRTPTGDVYLWPANEAMHVDIASAFNLPFKTRQDLQKSSYLFSKKDVDALGKFSNFDDLVSRLAR